jgi:hypothetical protein
MALGRFEAAVKGLDMRALPGACPRCSDRASAAFHEPADCPYLVTEDELEAAAQAAVDAWGAWCRLADEAPEVREVTDGQLGDAMDRVFRLLERRRAERLLHR